jgi:type IV pilus assembly protein PilC
MTDVVAPIQPSPRSFQQPDLAAVQPDASAGETPWYKREFYMGSPVKTDELMNFSRQAASFLQAGIPILDALAIIGDESASKQLSEILADLRKRLRAGSSFGDAIAMHGKVFPGYYIAMVRAAELTGQLDDVFEQLAAYLERDLEARRQVKSAMRYPLVVLSVAFFAMIAMAVFILPKFKELYSGLDAKLPLPTRMLLGFTGFMQNWFLPVALGFGLLVAAVYAAIGGRHGKVRRDHLVLKIPKIKDLVQVVLVERFCRVLGALAQAGVSLPDAVKVSADSANNAVFQEKLNVARDSMLRGEGLARPITATGMFPAAARQMIRVGESTGTLEKQLKTAASFYEREATFRLKKVTDMVEPIIILMVGGVVGFVAVAQVAAMYSIFSQIKT